MAKVFIFSEYDKIQIIRRFKVILGLRGAF